MKKSGNVTQEFILKAIDSAVQATGYPVVGQVLSAIDVDRKMAREMTRKGLLKSIPMSIHGQYVIGYYVAGGVYPQKLATAELSPSEAQESQA